MLGKQLKVVMGIFALFIIVMTVVFIVQQQEEIKQEKEFQNLIAEVERNMRLSGLGVDYKKYEERIKEYPNNREELAYISCLDLSTALEELLICDNNYRVDKENE